MRVFQFCKGVALLLLLSSSNSFALTRDSIIGMDEVTVVGERFRNFNTTFDTLARMPAIKNTNKFLVNVPKNKTVAGVVFSYFNNVLRNKD